jgi:hypothetical protein
MLSRQSSTHTTPISATHTGTIRSRAEPRRSGSSGPGPSIDEQAKCQWGGELEGPRVRRTSDSHAGPSESGPNGHRDPVGPPNRQPRGNGISRETQIVANGGPNTVPRNPSSRENLAEQPEDGGQSNGFGSWIKKIFCCCLCCCFCCTS